VETDPKYAVIVRLTDALAGAIFAMNTNESQHSSAVPFVFSLF
jgi:hypothetical protein